MKTIEGNLMAKGCKVCIISGRWNEFITSKLVSGAVDALVRHGASEADIDVIWAPGGLEIPLVAKKAALTKKYDAIVCVGVVLRGGTSHHEVVMSQLARGIASISLETGIPITNGVIGADNLEQAIERAGTKVGNKGYDVTVAAIEMIDLLKKI